MAEPVSVVVTCFNLQAYIREAIESVLRQDYRGAVQIIVVDDASTDESRAILRAMDGLDLVLLDRNGGVLRAMIAGLRAARHDVVFFLDGDDVWSPGKLTGCMTALDPRTAFCTHDLWYMNSDGERLARASRVGAVLKPSDEMQREALIRRGILEHLDYVWLGSAFGVRKGSAEIDGFIAFCEDRPELLNAYQDWPLAVWVGLQPGVSMKYVDRELFGYRLHGANYSGSMPTIARARRNFSKVFATARLIEAIMEARGAEAAHRAIARRHRKEAELLSACVTGGRGEVLASLRRNARGIGLGTREMKTFVRAMLALSLGTERAHAAIECLKRARAGK